MDEITKARFEAKFEKSDGCWNWKAAVTGDKRKCGCFWIKEKRRMVAAPRVSYELYVGPIGSLYVLHHCDNPMCVNPSHLFLGTQQDNMDDMRRKGRGPDTSGVKNGRAKLTEAQVKQIRSSQLSRAELARKYSVSWTAIDRIIKEKLWRHSPNAP